MPEKDKMIVVHVRCPGFEYIGKITMDEFLNKDALGYIHLYDFCPVGNDGLTVSVPKGFDRKTGGAWEEPMLIPRCMAVILRITIGGLLWQRYRTSIGEQIQVHETMPAGMPPEPGSVH